MTAPTRAEMVDVDSLSAERVVGPLLGGWAVVAAAVTRSSRWTADFEDEGEVSGLIVGVKRSLFNFLDAAERLAPHAPGENFAGCSSCCTGSGGGGVFGDAGSCGEMELFWKKLLPQRLVTPFVVVVGADCVDAMLVTRETTAEGDSESISFPNLKRLLEDVDGVGGSDSFSSLSVAVTRSSLRIYAIANVKAKSSTGRRCNNVIFSENPPSNNVSRCDLPSALSPPLKRVRIQEHSQPEIFEESKPTVSLGGIRFLLQTPVCE